MNATAEFDKAGRILFPKKVRDALHFKAGDVVNIQVQGETAILSHKVERRGMFKEKGLWVYDSGPLTNEDVIGQIDDMRARRDRFVSGDSLEP